jgi:hypothetical protein
MKKRISWERIDKHTFTLENAANDDELEDFLDDDDMSPVGNITDHVEFTLFGVFHKKSLQNPHNIYNYDYMYMGHMVGFNANSSNFYTMLGGKKRQTIDTIEGISIWRVIDAHKIVFIPAKYYDANDVMRSIEQALLPDEDFDEEEGTEIREELINQAKKISEEYEGGHAVAVLASNKIISSSSDSPEYNDFIKQINEIIEDDPDNNILIIDGNIQ